MANNKISNYIPFKTSLRHIKDELEQLCEQVQTTNESLPDSSAINILPPNYLNTKGGKKKKSRELGTSKTKKQKQRDRALSLASGTTDSYDVEKVTRLTKYRELVNKELAAQLKSLRTLLKMAETEVSSLERTLASREVYLQELETDILLPASKDASKKAPLTRSGSVGNSPALHMVVAPPRSKFSNMDSKASNRTSVTIAEPAVRQFTPNKLKPSRTKGHGHKRANSDTGVILRKTKQRNERAKRNSRTINTRKIVSDKNGRPTFKIHNIPAGSVLRPIAEKPGYSRPLPVPGAEAAATEDDYSESDSESFSSDKDVNGASTGFLNMPCDRMPINQLESVLLRTFLFLGLEDLYSTIKVSKLWNRMLDKRRAFWFTFYRRRLLIQERMWVAANIVDIDNHHLMGVLVGSVPDNSIDAAALGRGELLVKIATATENMSTQELLVRLINSYWLLTGREMQGTTRMTLQIVICQKIRNIVITKFTSMDNDLHDMIRVFIRFIVDKKFKKALKECYIRQRNKHISIDPHDMRLAKLQMRLAEKRNQLNVDDSPTSNGSNTNSSQTLEVNDDKTKSKEDLQAEFTINIFGISSKVIAREITLADHELFSAIKNEEWYKHSKRKAEAPNLVAMINKFNTITYWVEKEILDHERVKTRAKMVKKFIKIAQHLHKFGNYHSLMAVLSGLNDGPITRLKRTFEGVSQSNIKIMKQLNDVMNYAGNYSNYRGELEQAQCCVPYLGVFLRDLIYLTEGSAPSKKQQSEELLGTLRKFQQSSYDFGSGGYPAVRTFIQELDASVWVTDTKEFWKISKQLEPSEQRSRTHTS